MPLTVTPQPLPSASPSLTAADRAIAELRRGCMVVIRDNVGSASLILAAEAASPERLDRLAALAGAAPALAITGRRAVVLKLTPADGDVLLLRAPLTAEQVQCLADPCADIAVDLPAAPVLEAAAPGSSAAAAVALAKLARLLPAALIAPLSRDADALARAHDLFQVTADDVTGYPVAAARSLKRVSEARVPLADAENARIVAFRPCDGGIEHLAIIIGEPDPAQPVLIRLHSECFTGDLLGSLRCDCGDQLRGAIAEIAGSGSGVLLYLAQEGRGIGLVNKLRAYRLQDAGFDTLDANRQLGFDDDERIYLPAAEMLRLLDIGRVRLLTNNPLKVQALARHGVDVVERVPHIFPSNDHNEYYLRTKATKGGHLF